jgi:hypothetical protein
MKPTKGRDADSEEVGSLERAKDALLLKTDRQLRPVIIRSLLPISMAVGEGFHVGRSQYASLGSMRAR